MMFSLNDYATKVAYKINTAIRILPNDRAFKVYAYIYINIDAVTMLLPSY